MHVVIRFTDDEVRALLSREALAQGFDISPRDWQPFQLPAENDWCDPSYDGFSATVEASTQEDES